MAFTVFPTRGIGGFPRSFGDLRTRFAAARQRRAIYLRTQAELQALSDRDLADLGMHRTEIGRIAREAARRA